MTYKQIANLIPTIQSMNLVKANIKDSKKKKWKIDDMLHSATRNLVGTSLIQTEASLIGGL
jgi:hypothetical protein